MTGLMPLRRKSPQSLAAFHDLVDRLLSDPRTLVASELDPASGRITIAIVDPHPGRPGPRLHTEDTDAPSQPS
jgi:hypothetical protein